MKKTMTTVLVALVALAILISPVVFSTPDTAYAASDTNTALSQQTGMAPMGHGRRGGDGKDHGRHGVNVNALVKLLSQWSGYSTDTLISTMRDNNLNVRQLVASVILSKTANISLEDAAKIVAKGELRDYVEENNLSEQFRENMRDFMQTVKKAYHSRRDHGHRRKPPIGGRTWNEFVSVVAQWAGTSTEEIVGIMKDYSLNPARTINAVVLSKVANISLSQSASIVVNGELRTYIEDNNLEEQFSQARREIISLLKEEAQNIREKAEEQIAQVLAQWSGFDKDTIKTLIEEKHLGYTVNAVVLAKVGGISLKQATDILDNHSLRQYLKDNNLFTKFMKAKREVMRLIREALRP